MSAPSNSQAEAATTATSTTSPKLRQRNRILSAQNDSAQPRIDTILASKEGDNAILSNGQAAPAKSSSPPQPEAKAISTSRPTSPLMPLVRSLERLGEKVPSMPKMPQMPEIKLPASNIEVNFAPLQVPRQRRIQTATVAIWSLMLPICFILFFFLCSMPLFWPFIGPYLVWVFFFDKAPGRGGRTSMWFRRWWVWRQFAGYYPVSIIKEADLPPDRPYVFGYHPHGIIGTGAFANFATESTGFSGLFPGIKTHLLTLSSNFKIPFYRDLLLWLGLCSVSKKSCANILRQGPGSAITIVVGGAAESLAAHPGTNDLTLRKRLGFIKIAVREGADLVPVFSFGENDIYDQLQVGYRYSCPVESLLSCHQFSFWDSANNRGTTVYKIQKQFQKLFGFTLPLFHGRGMFNYNLGLMPFRHPIVSVVGRPIHVKKNENPPTALLEEYQKEYIEELMRIWEAYKDIYARNRTRELRLVE